MITQPHRLMTAEPNGSKQVRWSRGLTDHTSGLGLLGLAVMSRYGSVSMPCPSRSVDPARWSRVAVCGGHELAWSHSHSGS